MAVKQTNFFLLGYEAPLGENPSAQNESSFIKNPVLAGFFYSQKLLI